MRTPEPNAVLVFVLVLSLAACDTSVDPFQKSDRHFSVGGVIDATVDTQFVRLTPLRHSAEGDSSPLDAEVTTTDLATGETSVWHDSVFSLIPSGPAHNVWSSFDFEPGHSYHFTARTSDGRESNALVVLPDTFPDPTIQIPPFSSTATINVTGVEKLADLRLIFCGRLLGGNITRVDVPLIRRVSRFNLGFTVRVEAFEEADRVGLEQVLWIRILAMAAAPEWPDFEEIDEETLALPDVYSNIENGVGYLGGVTSRLAYWPGFRTPVDDACYDLIRRW
jgi:hypothetical protein